MYIDFLFIFSPIFCDILVCDIGLLVYSNDPFLLKQRFLEYEFLHRYMDITFSFAVFSKYCDIYRMVCVPVREDNPRTLASGLSPMQTQKNLQ